MCIPANAIKNMDFIGYVSVIATPEVLDWVNNEEEWEEPLDLSYFFGEEATSVHANPVLYADKSVIDRCALMHDAGEMNEELVKMWNRVKGDNLSSTMLIVVLVVLVLLIAFVVMQFVSKRNRRNAQVRRRRK